MSRRILVVEDQEDNRQILRDLLASSGYEMFEAGDGGGGRHSWCHRTSDAAAASIRTHARRIDRVSNFAQSP